MESFERTIVADALNTPRIRYDRDVVADVASRVFVTGTAENNARLDRKGPTYLTDETYAEALGAIVPVCVDLLVFFPDGRMLLGRRQQEPQPDWWVFGGRMRVRETFQAAAQRLMRTELGIEINLAQLDNRPVGAFSLIWDSRAQEPVFGGCHTVSLPFIYHMQWEEYMRLRLNKEYSELAMTDPVPVSRSDRYHPALRAMVQAAMEVQMMPAAIDGK